MLTERHQRFVEIHQKRQNSDLGRTYYSNFFKKGTNQDMLSEGNSFVWHLVN